MILLVLNYDKYYKNVTFCLCSISTNSWWRTREWRCSSTHYSSALDAYVHRARKGSNPNIILFYLSLDGGEFFHLQAPAALPSKKNFQCT